MPCLDYPSCSSPPPYQWFGPYLSHPTFMVTIGMQWWVGWSLLQIRLVFIPIHPHTAPLQRMLKGHIVLPCPSPSTSGVSKLRFSFSGRDPQFVFKEKGEIRKISGYPLLSRLLSLFYCNIWSSLWQYYVFYCRCHSGWHAVWIVQNGVISPKEILKWWTKKWLCSLPVLNFI